MWKVTLKGILQNKRRVVATAMSVIIGIAFLADGRIVDEMAEPTAERVLDRMKRFGE